MKKLYTILGAALIAGSFSAQTVFSSDLSSWSGGVPTDMMGAKSSIAAADVNEITTGATYGTSTAQLTNTTTSHKRFTTQHVSVIDQTAYDIEVYLKGEGEVRMGIFDGDLDGGDYGYEYTSYNTVNSTTTTMISGQVVADTTNNSTSEFIISLKSTVAPNHIEIDSIVVKVGTFVPPTVVPVYDIQYTTATSSPYDSPYEGQTVSTGGIVTYVRSNGAFYMSSGTGPWSSIYVYQTQNSVVPGDSVTFEAEVQEYNGLTELAFPNNFTIVSSGNLFFSNAITTAEANTEAYESALVSVCGQATDVSGVSGTTGYWSINDGSGDGEVDDYLISNYPIAPAQGTYYAVKGIVSAYSPGAGTEYYSIQPRNAGDMQVSTSQCGLGIEESVINYSVYPNPTDLNVTVELEGTHLLNISDITGKIVESMNVSGTSNVSLEDYTSGIYFFNIEGNVTKVIVK